MKLYQCIRWCHLIETWFVQQTVLSIFFYKCKQKLIKKVINCINNNILSEWILSPKINKYMWNGKNNYIIYISIYEQVNCFYTKLKYFCITIMRNCKMLKIGFYTVFLCYCYVFVIYYFGKQDKPNICLESHHIHIEHNQNNTLCPLWKK